MNILKRLFIILLAFTSCNKEIIIVADGNSLTKGKGSSRGNTYPDQLRNSLNGVKVINLGIGGQTTSEMLANAKIKVDTLTVYGKNIVLVWEGRNHLVFGSGTEEAYNSIRRYCLERKKAGFKVVVATIIASTTISKKAVINDSVLDFQRLELNKLILENWSYFADGIVDFSEMPEIYNYGNNFNSTLFTDGTHLTDSGYELVFKLFKAEVDKLIIK